jgi:hypothetical protein
MYNILEEHGVGEGGRVRCDGGAGGERLFVAYLDCLYICQGKGVERRVYSN